MSTIFCFLLCLCLWSCQSSPSKAEQWKGSSDAKIKVLCTTPIIDDLVARIGGERIHHLSLMEPSMDPHSYELVKGDDEKFSMAQIVFYNGLGLEHSGSLITQLKSHAHAVAIGEAIREQDATLILEEQGQIDPHIWLDVSIWTRGIDPIVFHLSALDPEGADHYLARGTQVREELGKLDLHIQESLDAIPSEKKYLVTSHDAFNYFARRYLHSNENWKTRFCAPEGLAPDGQLGFIDLERVIAHVEKNSIRTVFPEANVSQDSLHKIIDICKGKNQSIELSAKNLFSDTLSDTPHHIFTYDEMMLHNAAVLCEYWSMP